jgi:arabinoxylan arabinofuranohydrolase
MKTVTTYFFVLMVIPAAVVMGGELLTNPGFESGLTGWSVSSSNGWASASTTPVHSGAKSAVFTAYDTTAPYSAYVLATQSRIRRSGIIGGKYSGFSP